MTNSETIRRAMSMLGKRKSEKKAAASRANGSAPCKHGKRRGRPKES